MTTQHPLTAKVGNNFAGFDGRLVGIVRLQIKTNDYLFWFL
jgi:hypothetical protein